MLLLDCRLGLVVTHFVSRFLYSLHLIFKKVVLTEPLATIEQYWISFNRNTMVVNDHFIRKGHTTFNYMKSDIQSALQCKEVQSSIEKFHWSKKLRKTENFSFNLNIRVPLKSVNLFLHVFLYLKVILTMEHNIKLLLIFI